MKLPAFFPGDIITVASEFNISPILVIKPDSKVPRWWDVIWRDKLMSLFYHEFSDTFFLYYSPVGIEAKKFKSIYASVLSPARDDE